MWEHPNDEYYRSKVRQERSRKKGKKIKSAKVCEIFPSAFACRTFTDALSHAIPAVYTFIFTHLIKIFDEYGLKSRASAVEQKLCIRTYPRPLYYDFTCVLMKIN